MRSKILGVVTVGLCALAACNGSGTPLAGDGAVDAAIDRAADAAAESSTAGTCSADVQPGQACNALVVTGAGATPTCTTGTMPTGQGGTIVDGTYVLTAATYYNDPTCPTFPVMETLAIAGGCLQVATGPAPFAATLSGTFTVAGNTITTTQTCVHLDADGATIMQNASITTFTATSTTFTLFTQRTRAGNPTMDVAVFTKQ